MAEHLTTMLTEELRAAVGREVTYVAPEPLGRAAFRYFARAVGDPNPIYVDTDAARAAGFDGVVAPPTLVVETNAYADREPDAMGSIGHRWDLHVPGTREIRGGHTYSFGRPARPDDVLHVTWRVDDVVERTSRSGTPLAIMTTSQVVTDAAGEHLATNIETTIFQPLPEEGPVRSGPAPSGPAPSGPAPSGPAPSGPAPSGPAPSGLAPSGLAPSGLAPSDLAPSGPAVGDRLPDLVRTLDVVAMVAYAGATWDWYRTHYDAVAVADAQLPAPIVDGQQLGAMLAAHALAGLPAGSRPTTMAFRFTGMVFAGETATVSGEVTDVTGGLVTLRQRISTDAGTVAIDGATMVVRPPGGAADGAARAGP